MASDKNHYFFAGPRPNEEPVYYMWGSASTPKPPVTAEERDRVSRFLVEVRAVCTRYGLALFPSEDGLWIADKSDGKYREFCSVEHIAADGIGKEPIRWD